MWRWHKSNDRKPEHLSAAFTLSSHCKAVCDAVIFLFFPSLNPSWWEGVTNTKLQSPLLHWSSVCVLHLHSRIRVEFSFKSKQTLSWKIPLRFVVAAGVNHTLFLVDADVCDSHTFEVSEGRTRSESRRRHRHAPSASCCQKRFICFTWQPSFKNVSTEYPRIRAQKILTNMTGGFCLFLKLQSFYSENNLTSNKRRQKAKTFFLYSDTIVIVPLHIHGYKQCSFNCSF